MFKSQLQEYAQKASIPSPVYEFVKEGASHEPRFKASVILNNRTYSSPPGFPNLKAAEHAAAKAALDGIFQSTGGTGVTPSPVHESGLCKNMLQEYAQKNCLPLPVYQSHRSGEDHAPTFTSSVEIAGVRYTGGSGKNKKEAEIKAARTAYLAIKSAQPSVCAPQFLADSVPPQNVGLATLLSSQMPTSGKRRGRGAANPMADEPAARRLKTGLQTPHAAQEAFMKAGASTPMTPPGPYCPTMTPASYVSSVYTVPAFSPAGHMQGNYYPAPAVLRQPVFSPPAMTAAPVIQPSPPAMTAAPVSQPSPPAMTAAPVIQPSPPAMTAAPVTQPSLAPVAEAPATVTPAAAPESIQAPVTVPAEPAPIAIAPNLTGDVIQGPATLPDVPEVQQVPAVSPTMPTVDISDLFVVPEARKILEKIPKIPRPEQPLVTEETSLFSSPVQGTAILSTSSVLAAEQQPASTDNHAVIQEPKSAVENGEAAEGGKETPVEKVQLELVNGPSDAKDSQPVVQALQSSGLICLKG